MIIDYFNIEKINFLNYEINDTLNLNVINCFKKIYAYTLKEKIDFVLTGNLASVIFFNKMYRNLNDIDFIINPKQIHLWFNIFFQKKGYGHESIEKMFRFKYLKEDIFSFSDDEFKCRIDIVYKKLLPFEEFQKQCILHNNLYIFNPIDNYKQKLLNFNRQKDIDDWNFCQRYLI